MHCLLPAVALLTERIRDLSAHFQTHKKDEHSRRGLAGLLNQRRALLRYLRASNFQRFCFVIHKLGLKDTFAKQVGDGRREGGCLVEEQVGCCRTAVELQGMLR
jgi:ribosomal protein S15